MTSRIVILGAGPAGLSAGLWLKNMGFDPMVLEKRDRPGGMLQFNFLENGWVLGHPGVTGQALGRRFHAHAASAGVEIRTGVELEALRSGACGGLALVLRADEILDAAALVVATGTRFRAAEVLRGVPGADALASGQLACGPYAFLDLAGQAGKRVLVIGGGDNAYENAGLLLDAGAAVTILMRTRARARRQMRDAVEGRPGLAVYAGGRVLALRREAADVVVTAQAGDEVIRFPVDRIHILAGYEPNTAFLADVLPAAWESLLRRDPAGYLRVDAWGRTGIPGIYAAGDVCNPDFAGVVSALAQGAKAARAVARDIRGPDGMSMRV